MTYATSVLNYMFSLEPSIGDVRLVNPSFSNGYVHGTVEIFYDDGVHGPQWGRVCGSNSLSGAANVVCRQLGYSSGKRNLPQSHNEGTNRSVQVGGVL